MFEIQTLKHKNKQLNQLIITNKETGHKASIFPNLGASLQNLTIQDTELIDGITADEVGLETYKSKFNSSILFPFPSRIENGTYSYKGKHYALACNEKALNNALHGHVHNKCFRTIEELANEDEATIKLLYEDSGAANGFPFPYKLEITYRFFADRLQLEFNISNSGSNTFPFGIGWHPYFKTRDLNNSILDLYSEKQHFLNEKMIPEKEVPLRVPFPLRIGENLLDDCFILKSSRSTFHTTEYALNIKFSSPPPTSFLQTYTPPGRDSIAIEPMTCAGNSFNNRHGLLELAPNMSYKWIVDISIQLKN